MRKKSGQPNEFGIFIPGDAPAAAPAPKPVVVEEPAAEEAPEEDDGFNPDARDGDGDGMVQDGTEWERPVSKRSKKRGK